MTDEFEKTDNNNYSENNMNDMNYDNSNYDNSNYDNPINDNPINYQMQGDQNSYEQPVDYNYQNNYGESPEAIKARQQAEREKVKYEQKRIKATKKMEKKAAKKAKRSQNGPSFLTKLIRAAVCAVVFGIIAIGTMYGTGRTFGIIDKKSDKKTTVAQTTVKKNDSDKTTTLQTSTDDNESIKVQDVSDVVENVMPSIVAITSKQKVQSGFGNNFFGYNFGNENNSNSDEYQEETGAGSGIIIKQTDSELLIVTNNHVVEGADSLQVQFIDDETVDATVKGTNADKDLAIVAIKLSDIKQTTLEAIKVASVGSSKDLKVGEGAIAIGNALGYGQSVTTGVISALDREVTVEDNTMKLIQTDAAINPGNSGGALLNMKGEVIGINAAKYSSSSVEGMGFAIPISSVSDVIENLMSKETLTKVDDAKKGYLNIYGRDVTPELAEMYSVPEGVYVLQVIDGGAAKDAGIEKSDVITAIDGDSVKTMNELQNKLTYYESGKTVKLTVQYLKDKKYVEKEVDVVLSGKKE